MHQVALLNESEPEARKRTYRTERNRTEPAGVQDLRTLRNNVHRAIHEISRPFQSVVCFLHLARCKLDGGDAELGNHVDRMISETKRINDLLRRITALVDEAVQIHNSPSQTSLGKDEQLALDLH